jgi:hypothetical protein
MLWQINLYEIERKGLGIRDRRFFVFVVVNFSDL